MCVDVLLKALLCNAADATVHPGLHYFGVQDLFSREHNAIAAAIAVEQPYLCDEEIFRKARLATSAVIAKIHTIDWTVEVPLTHMNHAAPARTNQTLFIFRCLIIASCFEANKHVCSC